MDGFLIAPVQLNLNRIVKIRIQAQNRQDMGLCPGESMTYIPLRLLFAQNCHSHSSLLLSLKKHHCSQRIDQIRIILYKRLLDSIITSFKLSQHGFLRLCLTGQN